MIDNINWYPGHMKKTRELIRENLKAVDAVIEIVDSRIPVSSRNPVIDELISGKRRIVVLGKSDLADEKETAKLAEKAESDLHPSDITLGANIRFTNGELIITTGTAFNIFTLDKSIEKAWDNYFPSFLESNDITLQYL